jgi:hypothetical protein
MPLGDAFPERGQALEMDEIEGPFTPVQDRLAPVTSGPTQLKA